MRLGPASAGPLSCGRVAGFDFAKPFSAFQRSSVPALERDGVAAARSNLCLVGERRSRTRRLTILNRGGRIPGRPRREL